MSIEPVQLIKFGKGGTSEHRIGNGWSLAEDGYRWMTGAVSNLTLGPFEMDGDYLLVLELDPFINPPELAFQTLIISVDGIPFVQAELDAPGRYGYLIPHELIRHDGEIQFLFDHPDATRPSDLLGLKDHRLLSISVRTIGLYKVDGSLEKRALAGTGVGLSVDDIESRTGLPPDVFMTNFESMGENCEFGLVQRRCGAEPLSLLRFSNTLLPNLLRGLDDQFRHLTGAEDLEFRLEGKSKKEYIIEEKYYGLVYHTFRYKGEIEEDKFLENEAARLKFLIRKLKEDLKEGNKLFIYRRNDPLVESEILPLVAALNVYGPNTLFWVVPADRQHLPGTVEYLMPGLLKGYIDRFAPNENAHDLSLEIWLELAINAFQLWRR